MSSLVFTSSCHWTLQSNDPINPNIELNFDQSRSVCIGRVHFKGSPQAKHISSKHIQFHLCSDSDTLIVKALSKFDVIYIEDALLKRDATAQVKAGVSIKLCLNHAPFTLICKDATEGSPSACDHKVKRKRNSSPPQTGAAALLMGIADGRQNSSFMKQQARRVAYNQCEVEEASIMAMEDLQSAVYNRMFGTFAHTKTIIRGVLSSFRCEICLEVIAGCRSCVPCGHCFCVACITNYMAHKRFGNVTCPNCRGVIKSVIPNKTIDSAISDCLTSVQSASKAIAKTCPSRVPRSVLNVEDRVNIGNNTNSSSSGSNNGAIGAQSSMPPPTGISIIASGSLNIHNPFLPEAMVSESQDIDAWEARYQENENASKEAARIKKPQIIVQNIDVRQGPVVNNLDIVYRENMDNIDCSDALVEHARSGRSRCIHCHLTISSNSLRFGVTQTPVDEGFFSATTRFVHVACGRDFNEYRRSIGGNTISLLDLRFLNNLSNADRNIVENAL